jgi:hypothetical protein
MVRLCTAAAALALAGVVSSGCTGSAQTLTNPFAVTSGVSSGPSSGLWGDGSSGPTGMNVGCIDGRRFAVLITVHNRTAQTVTLVGGEGQRVSPDVIDVVAVQVRLAPPPPKGDAFRDGLRSWSARTSAPVAVARGRDAWVQLNFLMRACGLLDGKAIEANHTLTLVYRQGGHTRAQAVSVPGAKIILTRGPAHPSLPINQTG